MCPDDFYYFVAFGLFVSFIVLKFLYTLQPFLETGVLFDTLKKPTDKFSLLSEPTL